MPRTFEDKFKDPINSGLTKAEWEASAQDHFNSLPVPEGESRQETEAVRQDFFKHASSLIEKKFKPDDIEEAQEDFLDSISTSEGVERKVIPEDNAVAKEDFLDSITQSQGIKLSSQEKKEIKTRRTNQLIERQREGGFKNALIFGLEGSTLLKAWQTEGVRPDIQYAPKGLAENVAFGMSQIFGDLPLFAAGAIPGFTATRALNESTEIRQQQGELELSTDNLKRIGVEAGKGFAEGFILGKVTKGLEKFKPRSTILKGTLAAGKPVAEAGTIVVSGAALDQRIPEVHDFSTALGISLILRSKSFLQNKAMSEGVARAVSKRQNIPLTDARKLIRIEKGASQLREDFQKDFKRSIKAKNQLPEIQKIPNENPAKTSNIDKMYTGKLTEAEIQKAELKQFANEDLKVPTYDDLAKRFLKESKVRPDSKTYRSTLKAFQGKFITGWGQALSKDTPTGKLLVQDEFRSIAAGELYGGSVTKNIENILAPITKKRADNVLKLNEKQSQLLFDLNDKPKIDWPTIEASSGLSPKDISKVKKMQPEIRKIADFLEKNYSDVGGMGLDKKGNIVPFERVENYMPRKFDGKKIQKNPVKFIAELMAREYLPSDHVNLTELKNADKAKQRKAAEDALDRVTSIKDTVSNFAKERKFPDISNEWYRRDMNAFVEYAQEIAMSTESIRVRGPRNEILRERLGQIAVEANESYSFKDAKIVTDRAINLAEALTGQGERGDARINSAVAGVLNYQVLSKMITSTPSQLSQVFAPIYRHDFWSGMRGIGRALRGKVNPKVRQENLDFIRESGINLGIARSELYKMITGAEGKLSNAAIKSLRYTGFEFADAFNRTVSGLSGMFYNDAQVRSVNKKVNGLIKQFGSLESVPSSVLDSSLKKETRRLGQSNINIGEVLARAGVNSKGQFEAKLTDLQKKLGAREGEVDVNFRARAIDLPAFRNSLAGRIVTQFKSFSFSQTKNIRDNVVGEARAGNFTPLVAFMAASGASGVLIREIRNLPTKNLFNYMQGNDFWKDSPVAKMFTKDQDIADFVAGTASAAGMLGFFEQGVSTWKYGDTGLGPTISGAFDLAKALSDTSKSLETEKSLRAGAPLAGALLRQLPLGYQFGKMFRDATKKKKKKRSSIIRGLGAIK